MKYVGLDVHYRTSTVCILNENGKKVKTRTIRGPWSKLLKEVRAIEGPWQVCFEANCGYGYLHDELSKMARRVVVAHPGQLRLIFRCKRKNDRVDAEKLAKLLYLDEVPPAYVPQADVRSWRELIEYRRRTVDKQTACKSAIRALLRGYGVRPPKSLWSKPGLAWLQESDWTTLAGHLRRDMLLEELQTVGRRVATVTHALNRIGKKHPGVSLLKTIPGVGDRTAETIMAYIDNPDRFSNASQVAAYFGLIPCQDASAGANRLGHITRQGPATARKYLTEAAWQGRRRSPVIRAYFERIAGGKRERRKIAVVATAHYLLRCMYAMLCTGEVWREAA